MHGAVKRDRQHASERESVIKQDKKKNKGRGEGGVRETESEGDSGWADGQRISAKQLTFP